jgi:hypothetical protein
MCYGYGYDFAVIEAEKKTTMKSVLRFHHGHGYQDKILAKLNFRTK